MNEQHPATIKIIKGQQHAPEEGSEILITTLQTMQKRLDEPDSKLNAQNARISRLETLSKPYLDIRERCFTTHLRSFWRDFIIPSDVEMTLGETRALIKSLVGLHGGHAEADAIMFEERRPARELRPFVHIYGVQPATIREIVSKGYKGIMRMLDTLLNYFLKKEEQGIFDQVKDLVKGELDQAEVVSKDFPFED